MKSKLALSLSLVLLANILISQYSEEYYCSKKSTFRSEQEQFLRAPSKNQNTFDIGYYKLEIEIFPNIRKVRGTSEIHFTSLENSVNTIELDLNSNLVVSEVLIEGEKASFDHISNLLTINLGKKLKENDTLSVLVSYSGEPGGTFHFDKDNGKDWIWSLSEPYGALDWFPCKNLPDDKIDSMDIVVTVPDKLMVVSNGTLQSEEVVQDKKTFHWKEKYPISSYLVSVAIHPYKIREDYYVYGDNDTMPVLNYILPSKFDANQEKYAIVPEMISVFAEYYGEYPFIEEKYGNAEIPYGGGMEHQTVSSVIGPYEVLLAHELGHQWWGDMITCKSFHHIWLNEGFATYSEALWAEHKQGAEGLHNTMKGKEYLGHGTVYVDNVTHRGRIFDGNLSYRKAGWVLHMLRHYVGDDIFFQILKNYADSGKKYDVATTEDFREICEETSGINLEKFFDQWIYGDYHPVYFYDWSYQENGEKYDLLLQVEQFQIENQFSMPIDIIVTTEQGEDTFKIQNQGKIETYFFSLDSKPVSVELDRDNWILKEVKKGINLINHDNNDITLTISSDGGIGYDLPDGTGNGLIYPNGGDNCLFYGTLMIGNENYIADNSEKNKQKDFQKLLETRIKINQNDEPDLDIEVNYSDANHPNSKNIIVKQTSASWIEVPNRETIIFNYEIVNNGTEDLKDFYVSQFLDFDIGSYLDNKIGKNEENKLIYQYNDDIYLGIRVLNDSFSQLNYVGILNAVDNLDEDKKYRFLSGINNDFDESTIGDWSSLLSAGTYNFLAGDTLNISFAVVAGTNYKQLVENSKYAQNLWDDLSTDITEIDSPKKQNFVTVYPNPVIDKINFDIFLQKSQEVILKILDADGKEIIRRKAKANTGNTTLTVNRPIAKGLYFYQIITESEIMSGKIERI